LSSGTAPTLPPSGWRVLYQPALQKWLTGSRRPSSLAVAPVMEWITECETMGPPGDSRPVRDDLYIVQILEARVTIEYLVVDYEFLVLIKRIT
jgi:hypothetical protein